MKDKIDGKPVKKKIGQIQQQGKDMHEIDGLIDEVADAAVSTAIAIDTGEVTLEDGQAHLKKMIDSGKHQVHTLMTAQIIAELERLPDNLKQRKPNYE